MTTYMIDSGDGNWLANGGQDIDRARALAQREANERGEAVTLYESPMPMDDDGDACGYSEQVEPDAVTATARAEFAGVCAEIGTTVESEQTALLSIGREFLPPAAVAVLDGGEPTAEFYAWAQAQTKEASDEQARTIAAGHEWSAEPTTVQCACGAWSGERCQWSGPMSETVVVEYMPEHLRGSHAAAGNRGSCPGNGARRIRVESSCADRMIEHDGDWCEIVEPADR